MEQASARDLQTNEKIYVDTMNFSRGSVVCQPLTPRRGKATIAANPRASGDP